MSRRISTQHEVPSLPPAGSDCGPSSIERMDDAVGQLLRNNAAEYRRYTAARAVRALRESADEKPASAELRRLSHQAGEMGRWRRRRPALLRAVAAQRDHELPDYLQAPLPPHSRWMLDTRAGVLFNVFTGSANQVEDFYLAPLDDVWRTHRYGVYGLRYKTYPNVGTQAVPHDGSGLYYRPTKKILADANSVRRARKLGLVVTLQRVKEVAARAVGQFFPKVHKQPDFFDEWPDIDTALGAAIEYFYHYFELRRVEETAAQRKCLLYNSNLLDERRRRMDECVAEWGQLYSTYLLGFDMAFHHLKQGDGYRSASASDRHVFEMFYAFVAQCVWIVYRRPNMTVIAREIGRLFRTPGFDPARRAPAASPTASSATGSRSSAQRRPSGASKTGSTCSQAGSARPERRSEARGHRSGASGRQFGASGPPSKASGRRSGASGRRSGASGRQSEVNGGQPGSSGRRMAVPPSTPTRTPSSQPTSEDESTATAAATTPADSLSTTSTTPADPHASRRTSTCEMAAAAAAVAGDVPDAGSAPDGSDDDSDEPVRVSMKRVYGLYTGEPTPPCAVFGLIGATSQLLRRSLGAPAATSERPALPPVDRSRLGILGTPLQHYDDVLAAVDDEREAKEARLQFLGPSSKREGASRVAGIIPYLLLPSKFFAPDV